MKLRNKKTGEINLGDLHLDDFNSLAELNAEWEDYEEPKEYWYIDYDGGILCGESDNSSAEKMMISMGNHFESLKKADKAVEKLKAWKRLKDKGFRFDEWDENHHNLGIIEFSLSDVEKSVYDFEKDLNLLFGGEE